MENEGAPIFQVFVFQEMVDIGEYQVKDLHITESLKIFSTKSFTCFTIYIYFVFHKEPSVLLTRADAPLCQHDSEQVSLEFSKL